VSTTDGVVDLFADPIRHLIAVDPQGRDLLLSCGAALHHLSVALADLGWSVHIERLPDPESVHHLARVRPRPASPTAEIGRLARAIERRRTDRRCLSADPVGKDILETLIEHATKHGAELHVVAGSARAELIGILTLAGNLQYQQLGYAAELARWTSRYAHSDDGVDAVSVPVVVEQPGEVPIRAFPRAELAQSPHSFTHREASSLLVLATRSDGRLAALRAGEAASAVLLAATDLGLATTPLSQPLEVPRTREAIRDRILVGTALFPQLLVRVGWPQPGCPDLPPTPRRGLDRVLLFNR
jgi:nitroreductase